MNPTFGNDDITSQEDNADFQRELERTKNILSKDDIVDSDDE